MLKGETAANVRFCGATNVKYSNGAAPPMPSGGMPLGRDAEMALAGMLIDGSCAGAAVLGSGTGCAPFDVLEPAPPQPMSVDRTRTAKYEKC